MSSRRKAMARRSPVTGRILHSKDSELMSPAEVHRLTCAAASGIRDPTFGTVLGGLYLRGKIAASEYAAGLRWHQLVVEYDDACQAPRAPRSPALETFNGMPIDPDSEIGVREARRHKQAVASYTEGRQALRLAGAIAGEVVHAVCIDQRLPAGVAENNALRKGLRALSDRWHARKKSR
jgi:hypothetical protein